MTTRRTKAAKRVKVLLDVLKVEILISVPVPAWQEKREALTWILRRKVGEGRGSELASGARDTTKDRPVRKVRFVEVEAEPQVDQHEEKEKLETKKAYGRAPRVVFYPPLVPHPGIPYPSLLGEKGVDASGWYNEPAGTKTFLLSPELDPIEKEKNVEEGPSSQRKVRKRLSNPETERQIQRAERRVHLEAMKNPMDGPQREAWNIRCKQMGIKNPPKRKRLPIDPDWVEK